MITIAHADWSANPDKRWITVATGPDPINLHITSPERAPSAGNLLTKLISTSYRREDTSSGRNHRLWIGFDFPLGIPLAYAKKLGVSSFRELLGKAGKDSLSKFFDPAETASDVSIFRPFYPRRPGGTSRSHLAEGLGIESYTDLLRHCDRATRHRKAAGAIFWTMGSQQVGKAAISGWKDILQPALNDPGLDTALWPFDGNLHDLLAERQLVAAEVYPAEAAIQLGLGVPGRGWSKRSVTDRMSKASSLCDFLDRMDITISQQLRDDILHGFGEDRHGEDRFDSVLGLFSMIGILKGERPEGTVPDGLIRSTEGWILGQ